MLDFYYDNLIKEGESKESIIIKLLQARGFFIDLIDGIYYVSDNASIDDVNFLKEVLEKHDIGIVLDNKEYVQKTRGWWGEYALSRHYDYWAIKPQTITILINKNATIQSVIECLFKSEQKGNEAGNNPLSWARYYIEDLQPKIEVSCLEPYIAFYVKAISACGVYSNYSCDGNHPNGGKIYMYSDYPSNIWHRAIWDYIITPKFGEVPFIEDKIKFNRRNQKQVYQMIDSMADYLYTNRIAIRHLKKLSVANIKRKFRKCHSNEEIAQFYREECKRVLTSTENHL